MFEIITHIGLSGNFKNVKLHLLQFEFHAHILHTPWTYQTDLIHPYKRPDLLKQGTTHNDPQQSKKIYNN